MRFFFLVSDLLLTWHGLRSRPVTEGCPRSPRRRAPIARVGVPKQINIDSSIHLLNCRACIEGGSKICFRSRRHRAGTISSSRSHRGSERASALLLLHSASPPVSHRFVVHFRIQAWLSLQPRRQHSISLQDAPPSPATSASPVDARRDRSQLVDAGFVDAFRSDLLAAQHLRRWATIRACFGSAAVVDPDNDGGED